MICTRTKTSTLEWQGINQAHLSQWRVEMLCVITVASLYCKLGKLTWESGRKGNIRAVIKGVNTTLKKNKLLLDS